MESGVRAVFALPVAVAAEFVGALDLFRSAAGGIDAEALVGGQLAAELAALPLLDLWTRRPIGEPPRRAGAGWHQLASLERVEVYQATGMIMAELGVGSAEALVRLRAYAFAHGLAASEVGWNIVERRVVLTDRDAWGTPRGPRGWPA